MMGSTHQQHVKGNLTASARRPVSRGLEVQVSRGQGPQAGRCGKEGGQGPQAGRCGKEGEKAHVAADRRHVRGPRKEHIPTSIYHDKAELAAMNHGRALQVHAQPDSRDIGNWLRTSGAARACCPKAPPLPRGSTRCTRPCATASRTYGARTSPSTWCRRHGADALGASEYVRVVHRLRRGFLRR